MSKFYNETQKASQLVQKRLTSQELDINEILENLKQGPATGSQVTGIRLQECRRVEVRNGNTGILHFQNDESTQEVFEVYRGLRTKLMRRQAESGFKSIVISSATPGEGKTLTVLNLGMCYSQLPDQRVLVIDADLRKRGLSRLLGHVDSTGLSQVLMGEANPNEAILSTDQSNFFAMPAGLVSMPPAELFTGARWQELLGWCTETFTVVLVDTPPILPLADFELISAACDRTLMVVRAHHAQRELIQKTAGILDPKKLLGIILNASDVGVKEYYAYVYGHDTH